MLLTFTREAQPCAITAKLDEFGKPAWIALIGPRLHRLVALGLAILAFTIWSGRMGCGYHGGHDRWQHKMERMQDKMDRMRRCGGHAAAEWRLGAARRRAAIAPSTSTAAETLRRLEEEQREFREFPRPPALRQGQDRVRPVHGRAPQPAAQPAPAAELIFPLPPANWPSAWPRGGRPLRFAVSPALRRGAEARLR